ncbi:hypothetical protein FOMA001_g18485 [Fusarium oxysporum f. sp. matthiolae]|nr:hypothetical protein FOMA001_g18485 [Fusarium oxysporum f. sp. matthiolae]
MSFATTGFDILNRLALRIDPDAKLLICCRSTCRYALSVKGSAVTTHLRVKHQVEHDERKGLTEFLKGLGQSYLGDPSAAPLPKDGCSEHPDLRVYEGQGDLLGFEEQTPWIERTGWDKTYHGRSRDVLTALAAVSLSRGAGPHLLGRQGTNGLQEDIVSTMEDERKIAAVLEALDALLDRCEETARVSVNNAAAAYGINRSTLQDRIKGATTPRQAHEPEQKLSAVQERRLRDWIVVQADLGCPVSHQQVRHFANQIAVRNGFPEGVGKRWLQSFMDRNKEVKTLPGKRMDFERYNGASTELIKAFFMLLSIPAVRIVKQKNRYNVDEVGMMEEIGLNCLFLGYKDKKSVLIRQPGPRSWITILECISATGKVLRPLLIFKGKTVQQQHFPENLDFLEDWEFTSSEKGWTNNHIALIWLKMVFIPSTKLENPKEPRLLILDGHGSHMTKDFLFECCNNNIFVLFLPAHSSYVLQPLDVAVFGPLKRAYRKFLSDLASIADSSHIGKITFLYTYDKARKEDITKLNALAGWKATGL